MIPELIELGGTAVWTVLPPGIHWATLDEVETRFATNHRRIWLFEGLKMVAGILSKAGCVVLYVDGSFVTGKPHPNDFDVCWDPAGVRSIDLPAVLLDTRNRRGQKSIFRGDVVPMDNPGGGTFLDLFQVDKESGLRKGIIGIKLAPPAEVTRVVHA